MNTVIKQIAVSLLLMLACSLHATADEISEDDATTGEATSNEVTTGEASTEMSADVAPVAKKHRTLYMGVNLGMGNGKPQISSDADNGPYTSSDQFSSHIGLLVEKRITDVFHLIGSVELDTSSRIIASDVKGSESSSMLIGIGATIGHINRDGAPFMSFIAGYSKLDLGHTGDPFAVREPTSCSILFCFGIDYDDRRGASSTGVGFSVSAGMVLTRRLRLSVFHKQVGGDANDLTSGSTAFMRYTGIKGSATFK